MGHFVPTAPPPMGLDKLYRIAKKEFPGITRNEIKQWAENNLSYSLHKPSRRNFKCNKKNAPEIDSLWEADLAFVQDVLKENDGVNYLLVVSDVFSKFLWVRPMKTKLHAVLCKLLTLY